MTSINSRACTHFGYIECCIQNGYMQKTITSNRYAKLIQWLIKARAEKGLTIRALADELDINHSAIQRIESLERRLDVHEYVIYCRVLELDPHTGLEFL